jgi:hypothetical protein
MKTAMNRIGIGALGIGGVLPVWAQDGPRRTGAVPSKFPIRLSRWKSIWTRGQMVG